MMKHSMNMRKEALSTSYCYVWERISKELISVENGIEGEEADDAALDDNKNEILTSHSPSESSCHSELEEVDSGSHGSDKGSSNHDNQSCDLGSKSPKLEKKPEPSPEEKVNAILKEISQSAAAPDSTSEGDKILSTQQTAKITAEERHKSKHLEEAKIAELLNRGDTAVIYPEPVSDGEEHQNGEGGLSEEEIVLKCIHCPQTFLRAIVLRDHMREVHADKPLKFMCPKCDETFHQKSQLDKHLTLHSPTSQICTVCNKTFANVYRLQRHMISHNESTDLRKFKCPECGKAFKFKHHLKEHVRIHSGEKPFVCNNCGKRFSHSGSFSSHTTSKKCWGLSAHKNRVGQDGAQNLSQNQKAAQSIASFAAKLPMGYSKNKIPPFERSPLQSVPVSLAHQQHFLQNPYTAQKGLPAFYYPPQMFASADGFLHPVYSVTQSLPNHLPPGLPIPGVTGLKPGEEPEKDAHTASLYSRSRLSVSPAHSQSTRSFSPQSRSGRSISPSSASTFSLSSPPPSQLRRSATPMSQSTREMTPSRERASSISPHSEQISPDVNSNTKLLVAKDGEDAAEDAEKANKTTSVKTEAEDGEGADKSQDEDQAYACQYCKEVFESPVAQHQHERYMCKLNKDLVQHRSQSDTCQSPHSTVSDLSHVETTPNGSIGNDSDKEEEELYKDNEVSYEEKKMRIRSLFTEEQQTYLKKMYAANPRPKKFELIRMGNKIGFSRRVIQVWFQNMRARERKMKRDSGFTLQPIKTEGQDRELSKSPTYIPNVPKPFSSGLSQSLPCTPPTYKSNTGELPLDLSVRRTPPLAHGGSGSRLSTPDISNDDQVLNLSVKKDSSAEREASVEKQMQLTDDNEQSSQALKTLQDSIIYRHMEREGMISTKKMQQLPHIQEIQRQIIQQSMASILKMPQLPVRSETLESPIVTTSSSILFNTAEGSTVDTSKQDSIPCSRLVIDEAIKEVNAQARDSTPPYTRAINHAVMTSESSCLAMGQNESPLHEDTHNLATLAEAAQRAAILTGKPKRLRKKTWRQVDCYMESEEVQLDFDDSVSTDDDQPSKKKRKSWKNHRVDREEGMYGCDQCSKMFSKQSSLARHKYEHSGARPFACDMCPKSFKHKHHLTEHKRLHSGEKPFQCNKCGKRFSHSGSFSQHMNHRYNYCSPHKLSDGDGDLSSQESP